MVARILIRGEWFDAVASDAYWEAEFERLVQQNAATLYPEYHLVPFKTDVESQYGVAKPDFALVERTYRKWWVMEAELGHHSLHGHVLPQVQKLASGSYGPEHADYLQSHAENLDGPRLRNMMKGTQPRVVVVVNSPRPKWESPLQRHDAILEVVEIFRSSRNDHILRVNGAYPTAPSDFLSECRWDPTLRRCLLIESPACLGDTPAGGRVEIDYNGAITEWTKIETRDTVWLNPLKSTGLPQTGRFILVLESGRLTVRVAS